MKIESKLKDSQIYHKIINSDAYETLTKERTIKDVIGTEKYEKIKDTKTYKVLGDFTGLAAIKVILGMYIDSLTGLNVETSVGARGLSLLLHAPTSPFYTKLRNKIYEKGNITSDRSKIIKYGAELLANNSFQLPMYTMQIAAVTAIKAALDPAVEFDPEMVANGALKFLQNSLWITGAAKWCMDTSRKFFTADTPEELVDKKQKLSLEKIINPEPQ